jgi:agmatinase
MTATSLNRDEDYRPYSAETFASCRFTAMADVRSNDAVVVGVPYERTKISRPGAAEGPRAIREATATFGFVVTSMAGGMVTDLDSGRVKRYEPRMADVGDLQVRDMGVEELGQTVRGAVGALVRKGALPVILGGDHYITFPSVTGVSEALGSGTRLGYLHFDMHLDMAGEIPYWGKDSCGAVIHRLIDEDVVGGERITVIGAESFQHQNEVDFAKRHGISIRTVRDVRRDGAATVVREAAERGLSGAERLYVSIDIDCLNRTYAPGTGNNVGIGGLLPDELMEAVNALRSYPVAAIDMAEVSPRWDPSGRTPSIAASALIEFLDPWLFVEV